MGHLARNAGLHLSLLDSTIRSNQEHTKRLLSLIETSDAEVCGFAGATFKADTDDIRESPILDVISALIRKSSYQSTKKIDILDRPEALSKIRSLLTNEVVLTSSAKKLLSMSDCLVLGPFPIEGSDLVHLQTFRGTVIDLKYHQYSRSLKESLDWRPIC